MLSIFQKQYTMSNNGLDDGWCMGLSWIIRFKKFHLLGSLARPINRRRGLRGQFNVGISYQMIIRMFGRLFFSRIQKLF